MAFDPQAYKRAVTEEWRRAAQGWHDWIPKIHDWLNDATEKMLDEAEIRLGSRVIDIAAGDGGQSLAAAVRVGASGKVLATDIVPEFVKIANAIASRMDLRQLRAEVMGAEDYDFPREHWKHLRTSNVVESPFSRVRLQTAASRRFKSQVNATCLIWKTMMVAEMSFRKIDAPHLVEKVARGAKYDNGKEVRVAA